MQPPTSSAAAGRGRRAGGQRKKRNEKTDRLFPWRYAKQREGLQGDWLSADVRIFFFFFLRNWEDMRRAEEESDESHPASNKNSK